MSGIAIFTKLDGKISRWETDADTTNYELAIQSVKESLPKDHKTPVLALFTGEPEYEKQIA